MKNKTPVIILAAVLALVLLVAALMYDRLVDRERMEQLATLPNYTPPTTAYQDPDATDTTRTDAPEFTVYDGDGQPYTLDAFLGKPVVLNFWASWCGPCTAELPMFQEVYEEYGEDVHFLMINTTDGTRETRESADAMIEAGNFTFPVYYDTDGTASVNYSVRSLPTTYFIDANGKAIAYAAGQLDRHNFERGLSMCYQNQMNATTPETTAEVAREE